MNAWIAFGPRDWLFKTYLLPLWLYNLWHFCKYLFLNSESFLHLFQLFFPAAKGVQSGGQSGICFSQFCLKPARGRKSVATGARKSVATSNWNHDSYMVWLQRSVTIAMFSRWSSVSSKWEYMLLHSSSLLHVAPSNSLPHPHYHLQPFYLVVYTSQAHCLLSDVLIFFSTQAFTFIRYLSHPGLQQPEEEKNH